MKNQIVLCEEPSGPRHYLDEKPIHAGSLIEVFSEAHGWRLARYEWSFVRARPPIACIDEDYAISINDRTPARWPVSTLS